MEWMTEEQVWTPTHRCTDYDNSSNTILKQIKIWNIDERNFE